MILWLTLVAWAQPSQQPAEWAERVSAALAGSQTCEQFTGTAAWDHQYGDDHTRGSATIQGRMAQGQWVAIWLRDVEQDAVWRGEVITRPLTLQLRPFFGDAGRWALHHEPGQLFVRGMLPDQDLGTRDSEVATTWVETEDGAVVVHESRPLGARAEERTRVWFDAETFEPQRLERLREPHRLVGQPLRSSSEWRLTWRYGRPATEVVSAQWTRPGQANTRYHHRIQWTGTVPCVGDPPEGSWTSDSDNPFLDALQDPRIAAEDQRLWDLQDSLRARRAGWTTAGMGLTLAAGFGTLAALAPDSARRDINLAFAGTGGAITALGTGLAVHHSGRVRRLRASP